VLGGAVLIWSAAVLAGIGWIWRYASTPGTDPVAPTTWPAASRLERDPALPTLVMLAHPRCPCTRASLEELSALMNSVSGQIRTYIVFHKPLGVEEGWEQSYTLTRAREIPGAKVVVDEGGAESRRFGAHVSGTTLLYDERGHLLYEGGITGSRGHVGDNPGRQRLASLIKTRTADKPTSPVYGCPLAETGRTP